LLTAFYLFFIKAISTNNNFLIVEKNQNYNQILEKNLKINSIDLIFYKLFMKSLFLTNTKIHYGKFKIEENINFNNFIKILSKPSDYYEKITIIEGSTKMDLNKLFKQYFSNYEILEYDHLIADTYFFSYGENFINIKKIFDKKIKQLKEIHKKNHLSKKFSFQEILIIGSLLEKEGLDYEDKKKIYSVIINRLNKNMKLQIDATVIYALTKNEIKLNRKLNYKDLKIKDVFNTYFIKGLPPKPISYVGTKTIELIYENYKTNYLFYFYNTLENKHIYSINYENHLKKLNEYRSKK